MSVWVKGVQAKDVEATWPLISPEICRALKFNHDLSLADVFFALQAKQMQAWMVFSDNEMVGVCVTEIEERTRNTVCNIVFLAGKGFADWECALECLEDWARETGCTVIRAQVRKGFKPSGFKETHRVIERKIHDSIKDKQPEQVGWYQ